MDYVISFLLLFALIIVVNVIIALISRVKGSRNENTVRLPKAYAIIGALCAIVFLGIIIAYLITSDERSPAFIIVFSLFILACIVLISGYLNWRIRFGDELFEYRTMFRHTLKFKYSDITKVRRTNFDTILLKAKKRWLIYPEQYRRDEFWDNVKIKSGHQASSQNNRKVRKAHR